MGTVVYLYIPTSNHNLSIAQTTSSQLYIFIFLHQTTTSYQHSASRQSCISLYSYIKPQHISNRKGIPISCISLYSYIKPQRNHFNAQVANSCISLYSYIKPQLEVLVLSIGPGCISLYSYIKPQRVPLQTENTSVVYLYIPTSNHNASVLLITIFALYIFIFLHQTTTIHRRAYIYLGLYIFIFLHQTTTTILPFFLLQSCISLYSYIKPQLCRHRR